MQLCQAVRLVLYVLLHRQAQQHVAWAERPVGQSVMNSCQSESANGHLHPLHEKHLVKSPEYTAAFPSHDSAVRILKGCSARVASMLAVYEYRRGHQTLWYGVTMPKLQSAMVLHRAQQVALHRLLPGSTEGTCVTRSWFSREPIVETIASMMLWKSVLSSKASGWAESPLQVQQ